MHYRFQFLSLFFLSLSGTATAVGVIPDGVTLEQVIAARLVTDGIAGCEGAILQELSAADFLKLGLYDIRRMRGLDTDKRARLLDSGMRLQEDLGISFYERASLSAPTRHVTLVGESGPRTLVNFASNAYIDFQNHPRVKEAAKAAIDKYGTGQGAAPLLGGMTDISVELQERLARFSGKEAAALTSTGMLANIAWPVILDKGDWVIDDERSHTSTRMGLDLAEHRLKGKLNRHVFPHNDLLVLEARLSEARSAIASNGKPGAKIYITTEGIFSMDGDRAPLNQIIELCKKYNARLVVDDAHGIGVNGPGGRGTEAHYGVQADVFLTIGTMSKSLGSMGGFIAGPRHIVRYIKYMAEGHIFTTALTSPNLAAALEAVKILEKEPEHTANLKSNVSKAHAMLVRVGMSVPPLEQIHGGIIPVFLPAGTEMRPLLQLLDKQGGIGFVPVEFPAVPKDKPRLRLSFMSTHTDEDLAVLEGAMKLLVKHQTP